MNFFKCPDCGTIAAIIKETLPDNSCISNKLTQIKAGTTDAAVEKHVPVVTVNGSNILVSVGSVIHPMEEKHFIEWIAIETSQGFQIKYLKPGLEPKAEFALTSNEKFMKAYAYCNLHNLWASN